MTSHIQSVFDQQQQAKYDVALSDAAARIVKLEALKAAILKRLDVIQQGLFSDIGRPIQDDVPMEIGVTIVDIDFTIEKLEQWMQSTPVELPAEQAEAGASAYIQYEARGQILIMSAWNFPFSLAISPLIAAVSAGNVAMIKTNEMCPATAQVVADIVAECFSENEVAVFTGGVSEAVALQELPFDHVFFTGSPAVGKMVMAAAAKNLASVTLELGGKCPAIVNTDASMEATIQNIAIGRTFNLGQTCLCVDYAIVPESMVDALVQGLGAAMQAIYYDNGEYQQGRNSRIIDARNFHRVKGYIDDAVARGATIAVGGTCHEDTLIIEPTVLLNVPEDAVIMNNEVFGPVLAVTTYNDKAEILDIVRRRGKPLGMYIYTEDQTFVDYILKRTSSGGVSINGWANHYFELGLPFGGVNQSGQGSYHGVYGFRALSHARSVFVAA